MRRDRPTPPSLIQLHRTGCWWWVNCTNSACLRRAPVALVPLIIRWGLDASSDVLRLCARCSRCGRKGATLTAAGKGPGSLGTILPFPYEALALSAQ